jgi:hypothetical protein
MQYAVKVGDLQWVRISPGQSVARPEAIRVMKGQTASLKTHQRVTLVNNGPIKKRIRPASTAATDTFAGRL